jgi:hypothetical protein
MASGRSRTVTFEDEESNPDDCEDYFGELSDDEDDAMQTAEDLSLLEQLLNDRDTADGLSPSDWENVLLGNVQVTVGEATEAVFEQFIEEEEYILMAFKKRFGTERPAMHQLVEYFFGPDSRMFQAFKDNTSIHHNQFIKFMKTFCVQSAYKLSSRQMFDKNSYFDTSSLCTLEQYQMIWRQLGSACLPPDERARPDGHDTLWMLLEYALNRDMKSLLVQVMLGGQSDNGRTISALHVVCDDDKMPWEGKKT